MSLTPEQIDLLLQPLDDRRVRSLSGNSHLEAWDDRRWLLRIFGWGGFDIETLECAVVSERSVWEEKNPLKGRHTVVYRAQVRLIIKDTDGKVVAHFDDGAMGDGINQPSLMSAHDFAQKTALSQALKRCCVNLGDAFGLSLYSKGSTNAVVGRSIAHTGSAVHEAQEEVTRGELDEPAPDLSETSTVVPSPPVVEQAAAPPAATSPDADVEALRARVMEAINMTRQDSIVTLGRIKIDAARSRAMNAMTTSPAGEPMTMGVLLDRAINNATKKAA